MDGELKGEQIASNKPLISYRRSGDRFLKEKWGGSGQVKAGEMSKGFLGGRERANWERIAKEKSPDQGYYWPSDNGA